MNDFEVQVFNRVHPSVAPLCAPNMFVSKQIISATYSSLQIRFRQ